MTPLGLLYREIQSIHVLKYLVVSEKARQTRKKAYFWNPQRKHPRLVITKSVPKRIWPELELWVACRMNRDARQWSRFLRLTSNTSRMSNASLTARVHTSIEVEFPADFRSQTVRFALQQRGPCIQFLSKQRRSLLWRNSTKIPRVWKHLRY